MVSNHISLQGEPCNEQVMDFDFSALSDFNTDDNRQDSRSAALQTLPDTGRMTDQTLGNDSFPLHSSRASTQQMIDASSAPPPSNCSRTSLDTATASLLKLATQQGISVPPMSPITPTKGKGSGSPRQKRACRNATEGDEENQKRESNRVAAARYRAKQVYATDSAVAIAKAAEGKIASSMVEIERLQARKAELEQRILDANESR